MQQVLEAPNSQDEDLTTITRGSDFPSVLRAFLSAFTKTKPQHLAEFAATTRGQQESPCDHVYRTNPFLMALAS
jgi:hypothetical protein